MNVRGHLPEPLGIVYSPFFQKVESVVLAVDVYSLPGAEAPFIECRHTARFVREMRTSGQICR